MEKEKNNKTVGAGFDRLSGIYDLLVSLVFGRAIKNAQCALLDSLPQGGKVLLIGGGTGWLLQPLFLQAKPAQLRYVDASASMISKAKAFADQKIPEFREKIVFSQGTQDSLSAGEKYDVVITPFFLDLFSKEELALVFQKLNEHLSPNGRWYLVDFQLPENAFRSFARILIWLMYRFFRLFTTMSGDKLIDPTTYFQQAGLIMKEERDFYFGMIKSQLWVKMDI